MDLARPYGIVIDGNFSQQVIPNDLRSKFDTAEVYLKGISEEMAHTIFTLKGAVRISELNLTPLKESVWNVKDFSQNIAALRKISGFAITRHDGPTYFHAN